MELAARLKLMAPFVAVGLLVPLTWSLVVVALPEDRLATVDGALVIKGTPEEVVRSLAGGEPVWNVTVRSVQAVPGADVAPGQQVQVLLPSHALGAEEVRSGRALHMALRPAETHDPATGNRTFSGWALQDARAGSLWGLQQATLQGALRLVVPSVTGALLVGYALGLPRRVRPVLPEVDAPPALGGLLLGMMVGALLATQGGGGTWAFPSDADGLPVLGALGYALVAMAAVGAVWRRPLVLPNGGRAATLGGLALLVAPAVALVDLWGGQLAASMDLSSGYQILLSLGGVAIMVVVAARWLTTGWSRKLAAVALALPVLYLFTAGNVFLFLALPFGVLVAAGVADLLDPPLRRRQEGGPSGQGTEEGAGEEDAEGTES